MTSLGRNTLLLNSKAPEQMTAECWRWRPRWNRLASSASCFGSLACLQSSSSVLCKTAYGLESPQDRLGGTHAEGAGHPDKLTVCVASVHVSFHYKLDCWGIGQYKQMQLQPVCLSVAVQRNFFSRITSVQQSRFVSGLSRLPCAAITIHFIVSLSTLQLGAEEAVHEVCVSKTTDPIIVTSSKDGVCIHSTPAAQMVVSGHASQ